MIATTALYQTILEGQHTVEWKIAINGQSYGMSYIAGSVGGGSALPHISRSLYTEDGPSVGGCVSAMFTCSIFEASANVPRMATVVPSYRISNGTDTSEWISLGTFYIDTRSYDKGLGVLNLTCYDRMLVADGEEGKSYAELTEFTTWPQTMSAVVTEIASLMSVSIDSRTTIHTGTGYTVDYPNDLTMREVLGYIAAAHCGNWTITPDNKLRLIPITGGSDTLNIGPAVFALSSSDAFSAWSGVTVYWDDDEAFVAGDSTGRMLTAECPWAVQPTANGMLADITGNSYQPFAAEKAYADLALELGDIVTVGVTGETVTGIAGVIETTCESIEVYSVSAPGEDEIDHEYPYSSALDRSMKRKVTLGKSYYGTSISRSSGIEIKRSDGKSEAIFNADTFAMRALVNGVMEDRIYFDPVSGDYIFNATNGDLTAQIEQYIDSERGTAKVVAACSNTYQTISDMSNYVQTNTLDSSIGTYIDSSAGTAKVVAACSGTYQTQAGMSGYVQTSALDSGIESYINSTEGTAEIVAACASTYQTKSGMSSYVQTSSLNTSIGSYIDSTAGTAKVVNACSGTYQTQSDMSNYVQTSALDTSIESYINSTEGTAEIVAACASTYQTKSAMSGYVQTSNLNTSIGSYIDSTAGTAKVVSACSGTYQTQSGMSNYVQTSSLNTSIGSYIDSTAGTAKVVSACSATYQTQSGMSNYVQTANLSTSIGQYIDTSAGTAKIVSACSATYATITNLSTVEQTANKITWLVKSGTSASNFQLTDRAISLVANTIDLSGYVTFSNLSTSGQTTINGANITTGTITATQIGSNAITAAKISSGAVTEAKIGSDAVTTAKIAESAITETEIAGGAITTGKIAANAVTAAKIAANTITASQIAANTITASQIAASTITGAKIASQTIEAGNIKSGTITATQIAASTITGGKIAANTITADNIAANTITAAKIKAGTITATEIDVSTLKIGSLYNSSSQPIVTFSGTNYMVIGAESTSYARFSNIYITASSKVVIGWGGSSYTANGIAFDVSAKTLRPNTVSLAWSLGTSSMQFSNLYTAEAHFNQIVIDKLSSRYDRIYTTSTYSSYMGTADYPWTYGYFNNVQLGNSGGKIGFFGATQNAKQTLSLTSNNMGYSSVTGTNYLYAINNLIGILKSKYGLIT